MGSRRTGNEPSGFQGLDHLEKVAHRSGQSVEAHHDQDLTWPDLMEEPRQHRSSPTCPGAMLLVDLGTASGAQLVNLGVVGLILCGDTGIANQALPGRGGGHPQ